MADGDPLDGCDTLVTSAGSERRTRPGAFPASYAGELVGRYLVLERLGSGGMGVVFAAYDPELDRRVALKLLPETHDDAESPHRRVRLVREAQALARVSDPHVVTVYDAGWVDGLGPITGRGAEGPAGVDCLSTASPPCVFVAMELVRGSTLRAWLGEHRRAWPEILDAFGDAGRGLVAVHDAGLVHRDFKPDNVMVGDDDRVRVMDFGLAALRDGIAAAPRDVSSRRGAALDMRLTGTGAHLGTPAYMAPEQCAAERATPASDQFSFCVALWEALYRQRPFVADSVPALVAAITTGDVSAVPGGTRVPSAIARILRRGLRVDADTRWPDMRSLLVALQRARRRARWRWASIVAAGLAAGAVASGVALQLQNRAAREACNAMGRAIAATWGGDTRGAVHHALTRADTEQARWTATRLAERLDDYAGAWADATTDACLATHVEHHRSADLHERTQRCLESRRLELAALVRELSTGDAGDVVHRAIPAAYELPAIRDCEDEARLAAEPPPPLGYRGPLHAIRAGLARARALHRTGRPDAGLAAAREAYAVAEAIAWPPARARARHEVGRMLEVTGAYEEAATTLEAAYFAADAAGLSEIAAAAADDLAFTRGVDLARPDDGLLWSRLARAQLDRVSGDSTIGRASNLTRRASIHTAAGRFDEAIADASKAQALQEVRLGSDHPELAATLHNLGDAEHFAGKLASARRHHERALAILERAWGPAHPDLATSLNSVAAVTHRMGDSEDARRLFERVVTIFEASLGPDHPNLGAALNNLGELERALGATASARARFERAVDLFEAALGPEHPNVATSLDGLAGVHQDEGEHETALKLRQRVLWIREAALGPEHPDVARTLNNLAYVLRRMGRDREACRHFERALTIMEAALGPDHPGLVTVLVNLGDAQRAGRAYTDARTSYERAREISAHTVADGEGPPSAAPLVGLARTALATGDSDKAVVHAEQALTMLEQVVPRSARIDEVRALLERARSASPGSGGGTGGLKPAG